MYTVGRYISQGVYTVSGPFHPFGGAVDIIVVQQEDGTFKSSPWYVKFGKFQGVLKQKENVVDVAVNGNDFNFHMFLDATGEAYFLKDADLDGEGSILLPRSAVSSGDDAVVNTLAIESVKQDDGVQAKLELQGLQVQAETVSDAVLTSLHQNGAASDRGFAEEDGDPDGIASSNEHSIATSNKGQVSDEPARVSMEQVNTVESGAAIHALINHAIGLDPCYNSRPASSLVANAALVALEKVASSLTPPSTLECLPEKGVLKAPCIENGVRLFSNGTSPLSNSNQSLPMIHSTQQATAGSSLHGSNSLDSPLLEALPKSEFLRKGSGYSSNCPPGIMIASADGGVFLEEPYPEELGVIPSDVAQQQDQWASETNLTGFCPQQNGVLDPLQILDTRLHGPVALAEATEIQPDLEDTGSLKFMEESVQCKETSDNVCAGAADGPVVLMPSEKNSVSSVDEANPSPVLTTAIAQEIAWRDATYKAVAALRASPLRAQAQQQKQVLDRKTKPGGASRSSPKRNGYYKQNLPTDSTPAALEKNMQRPRTPQKKADGSEQSERKPWVWWGWRGSPALTKQSSDSDEKKDSKGVKGTTTDEVKTQTSSKAPEVGTQSSGSVDGQNSAVMEANKMLRIEDDAQKSTDEESALVSIDHSAERTQGNSSDQITEKGRLEDKKKEEDKEEEEKRDGLAIEVVSSIAIQQSQGKEAEKFGRRSSILGNMFQGHGREQVLASPEGAVSSLERAEIISDLLENSWECGRGVKNGQSPPAIKSQAPIARSSLNSQHAAAVKGSYSKASHSEMSEKLENMGTEEELAVEEGNDVPANQEWMTTGEMDEVVTTQNRENRSEDDLENLVSYRGTGAAVIKKNSHFESDTGQGEEEECHGKVAGGDVDHGATTPHAENGSEDELYNPLSYGDIGSGSRKSISFEANTSEEEEEILGQVVDGDEDWEIFRKKSDPIGVPVTLENSALGDMFLIAKDRPLSESLPDVRFQPADASISGIRSALSRSVGSEPLQHTQSSADRKDSSLENPIRSPAEGTCEGFEQNLAEKYVGSPLGSGRSEDESAGGDGAVPDLVETAAETGVEVSLCRHLLKEHMGIEEAAEAFASAKISLHEFKSTAASIVANDKFIVRVGGQYYPWSVAAPVVLGILTFGHVIMPATNGAIPVERPEPVPKSQAAVGTQLPTAKGGWNLWPFPLRSPKTPEQSIAANPLVSRDALLVAAETAVQSPFVNDLLLQNAYYERPLRNKVRTIIPTSQMLAQMNLKEGSNRITFTFFTRMLGSQQVDARVYLWKWNTRIVISDVDGTITKSDVLGQVMPLVGNDWTQSGVARLFSAIKENGYELLFLSARAISQADLTRQFLFNVKQDGETIPDGPVVISPDGLFPSLYREVIRRTPHEFKIACLQDIRSLFPEGCNPFYAGFRNRDTDEISYLKVGIPKGKIFIINPRGEVAVNNRVHVKTYTSLHKLVDDMFPAQTYMEQEDYNLWNFWKLPLPDIEDELKSVSASSSKRI